MLADKGYATAFFCGSERGSMGFGAYARSAGVERLVSREDYEACHGTGDFDGYWGIWDEEFLQFTGEELTAMPEPFFAALFTLSSHHPFVVPEKYAATLPDGYNSIRRRRASPTTTGRSASSSSVSAARSGSAARSSSSWPTTCRRRNSRRRRAPTRATCTSSASSTPPTAPCKARSGGHAAAGHHAHPAARTHWQYGTLFRIRARRAERAATAPLSVSYDGRFRADGTTESSLDDSGTDGRNARPPRPPTA